MSDLRLRSLHEDDYPDLIGRVDAWWGRPVAAMLPRLFFRHFGATSFAAVDGDGRVAGFLVGLVSPGRPGEAHAHFVAVAPGHRRSGLGRELYGRFLALAGEHGCRTVSAATSPGNVRSQRFHLSLGFRALAPDGPSALSDAGCPVWPDWDGFGDDRIRLSYALGRPR